MSSPVSAPRARDHPTPLLPASDFLHDIPDAKIASPGELVRLPRRADKRMNSGTRLHEQRGYFYTRQETACALDLRPIPAGEGIGAAQPTGYSAIPAFVALQAQPLGGNWRAIAFLKSRGDG